MTFEIVEGLSPQDLIITINEIISVDVMSQITSDPNTLMFTILPHTINRILTELKDQLLEIFNFHGITDQNIYNRFVSESHYKNIIGDFVGNINDNIVSVASYLTPKNMKGYLKSVVLEESDKLKRELIAENIIAGNWSREITYKEGDPNNINRYKFSVFMDNRTSRQCKEIYRRQNLPYGLPLNDLKELIREVAYAHEPNYIWRDWNPHFYCRSSLVRVFR